MDYKSSKGKRQSIYQSAAWLHRKNGTKMILVYLVMPTLNDKWYLVHFNFLHRVRDYYTIESEYVKKIIFTLLFLWKKTYVYIQNNKMFLEPLDSFQRPRFLKIRPLRLPMHSNSYYIPKLKRCCCHIYVSKAKLAYFLALYLWSAKPESFAS